METMTKKSFDERINDRLIWLHHADRLVAGVFGFAQGVLVAFAATILPWAVPLVPGLFAAFAVYKTAQAMFGESSALAIVAGAAFAIGLETAGVTANHVALKAYNAHRTGHASRAKVQIGLALIGVYFIVGVTVIWFLENTPMPVKVAGTGAFVLALISYAGQVMYSDLRGIELTLLKAEQADGQRLAAKLTADLEALKNKQELEKLERLERIKAEQRQAELAYNLEQAKIAADKEIKTTELRVKAEQRAAIARIKAEQSSRTTGHPAGHPAGRSESPEHSPEYSPEHSPEYEDLLSIVRQKESDQPWGVNDLMEWTGRQRTAAYSFLNYHTDRGGVEQVGRGKYKTNGKH